MQKVCLREGGRKWQGMTGRAWQEGHQEVSKQWLGDQAEALLEAVVGTVTLPLVWVSISARWPPVDTVPHAHSLLSNKQRRIMIGFTQTQTFMPAGQSTHTLAARPLHNLSIHNNATAHIIKVLHPPSATVLQFTVTLWRKHYYGVGVAFCYYNTTQDTPRTPTWVTKVLYFLIMHDWSTDYSKTGMLLKYPSLPCGKNRNAGLKSYHDTFLIIL